MSYSRLSVGLVFLLCLGLSPVDTASHANGQVADAALKQFYVANSAYNRKLYPVAIGQFNEFINKYGNHEKIDHARYGLALSYFALKRYRDASHQFGQLLGKNNLDQSIGKDRLTILNAQCLMFDNRKDEAMRLLKEKLPSLKGSPFESGAMATIADIAYTKSNWDEVITYAAKVLAVNKVTDEQKARASFQMGFAHFKKDQVKEAAAALSGIDKLECHQSWKSRGNYLLGECHVALQQYDQAAGAYGKAIPLLSGNDRAEAEYRLGVVRFIQKEYAQAAELFETYLEGAGQHLPRNNKKKKKNTKKQVVKGDRPNQDLARLYAARCAIETASDRKDYDRARQLLQPLLNEKSSKSGKLDLGAQANLWYARTYSRQGDYNQAANRLSSVLKTYERSSYHNELAFDYANALLSGERTDWKKAIDYFRRIEQRSQGRSDKFSQMPSVLSQMAVCYHQAGDYRASLDANNRFLERYKDHDLAADVSFMKGENLFLLGQLKEANQAYESYLKAYPEHRNHKAGQFRLAQILHDQNQWQASLDAVAPLMGGSLPEGPLFEQIQFMVGDNHFRLNQWEKAVPPLEAFVDSAFSNKRGKKHIKGKIANLDTALIQLAVAYGHQTQKDKALEKLKLLNEKYPYHPSPQLPLSLVEEGRLAYETGDLDRAKRALGRFLNEMKSGDQRYRKLFESKRQTELPRVHYYLGWIASTEKRFEESARHFADTVKANRNHKLAPDASLQQGIAYINARNYAASGKHFSNMQGAFRDHPDKPMLIYFAGLSQARIKNWSSAERQFRELVNKYPKDVNADNALYELAWCARERKREKDAVKHYQQLLKQYPESELRLKVETELSALNLTSQDFDAVITRLTDSLKAAEANSKDDTVVAEIRYQLASAHFRKGDHERAALGFEAMIKDYAKSKLLPSMYFQAGESRLKLAETVKAQQHYQTALKLRNVAIPDDLKETMTMRLGEMQLANNQFKQAAETYRNFMSRYGDSRWKRNAQFGRAFAMERGGDSKRAIDQYKPLIDENKSKKVDLWTVRAHYQIGECYFNLREYDKAIRHFLDVEVNYGRYPQWQAKSVLEIARVLIAQGKKEEARTRLKDVVTRYPKEKAAVVAGQLIDRMRSE